MKKLILLFFTGVFLLGAGSYLLTDSAVTYGKPYCGNPRYSKFTFENGQELLVPDAYLNKGFGYKRPPDVDGKYHSLVTLNMHKDDGMPNCNNTSGIDTPFVQVSVQPYRFEVNKGVTEKAYPYKISDEDVGFNLYRSINSKNPEELSNTRDFLIPKDQEWENKIFIECLRTGAHRKPNVRLGCTVRSRINSNLMTRYGYNHQYLVQYQNIDTVIVKTISDFIVSSKGE